MFCPYCGSQNNAGRKFCGNCGKSLPPEQQIQNSVGPHPSVPGKPYQTHASAPVLPVKSARKTGAGLKWASIGAGLAVLCFFLPWEMISSGFSLPVSGWQLSTGNYGSGYLGQIQALTAIFIILLLGLLGFLCLNGKHSGAVTALVSGLAGILGMIIVSANLFIYTPSSVMVTLSVGYFGEWLGFLVLAGVGISALTQMSMQGRLIAQPSLQGNYYPPAASTRPSPPPIPKAVPPANPTGLGSNYLDPNPPVPTPPQAAAPAKPASKKNNWKEIG